MADFIHIFYFIFLNRLVALGIFWILIDCVCCSTWTGSVYPIVHGNYYSSAESNPNSEEFNYWHADNMTLISLQVYSNEDILISYNFNVINGPVNPSNSLHTVSSIVKVDHLTGTTLWAKELFYLNVTSMVYFQIFDSVIKNDVSYHLLSVSITSISFPGIIVKVDSDGNVLNAVWALAPYDYYVQRSTPNINSFYLSVASFSVLSDSSLIISSSCLYYATEFGVSPNSSTDTCIFKIGENLDFNWMVSVDIFGQTEEK